jgi:CHAT domain-containing protein/tetratricopeptide (TPR) repeat protein
MKAICHLAVLVGMLIALPGLVCSQADRQRATPAEDQRAESVKIESRATRLTKTSGVRNNPDDLAQAMAARAAALRQKQTATDLVAAIQLLHQSARVFQGAHRDAQAADAYLGIGEMYFILSRYDEALIVYRLALKLAGDDRERRCQARSHMARTYAWTGHSAEGDSYSKEALKLSEGLPNPRIRAQAQEARGESILWSGDSLQSVESFSRARDLFAEAKDDDGQALALLMLARARLRTERFEALRLAEQATRLWSASGNAYGVAQARAFLGSASALAGQYQVSRCISEQALPVFRKTGDRDNEAIVLTSLGFVSMQTGDPKTSLEYYRQARAASASAQDWLGEAEAITGMGIAAAALGQYQRLLPLYAAKLRLARQAKHRNLMASALADLAGVHERNHEFSQAEALYLRSVAGYRQAGNPAGEGKFLILLAHLYSTQAKYSEAIALLERARPLKEKTGSVEELAKIDFELASVYRKLGRLDDALQAIQRTIGIIESQRLKMAAFDSRASYFASVHQYYALYVQLLMLRHSEDPHKRFDVTAFEASERSKVRSLLDWLAGSSEDQPCDELLKKPVEMADTVPVAAGSQPAPSSDGSPALTLEQIQAEIAGDDSVLLEYAIGDEKSYLWVVTKEQISSYPLPPQQRLDALAQGLRLAVAARQPRAGEESNSQYIERIRKADSDYRRYAAKLSQLLLGPASLNGVKKVLIVADGSLQYVPFAALSAPDEPRGKAILAADHEIILLPSGSALGALRKAVGRRPPPTAVAAVFADPVFEREDSRVSHQGAGRAVAKPAEPFARARSAWRGVQPGAQRIPRLRASRDEALAVHSLDQNAFVAEDFLASRETVLHHDLGIYRVIHFATHGILDEKHPERSGLILSLVGKTGEPQDGFLRLSDIYGLKLSADLVVLSSCDSGLGKDLSSEGIIGLPRAFLRAGAKSVIATLWKVDDEATAKLMTHFYARLRRGEGPASALRNAQLQLSRDEQWSHPYYWAAFVYQGDYR